MKRAKFVGLLIVPMLLVSSSSAWGAFVASSPSIYGFDFRFNTPGARANAMGAAFIGLADDATAAYSNPAGLTILTKPEISIEYKWGEYTTVINDVVDSGPPIMQAVEYDDTVQGPSFISYVIPKSNSTIAIYRHQLVNLKNSIKYGTFGTSGDRYYDMHLDINADTLGLGMGLKVSEPFSLGFAASFSEMSFWEYSQITRIAFRWL